MCYVIYADYGCGGDSKIQTHFVCGKPTGDKIAGATGRQEVLEDVKGLDWRVPGESGKELGGEGLDGQ